MNGGALDEGRLPDSSVGEQTVEPVVGGRIVVADDDATIRQLVAFQLGRNGASVVEAADGAQALDACRSGGVELAVIDIDMPCMTGFQVLRELKSDPATASLPVLLMTAHALQGGAVKGLGLGAHDYIRKPFELDELQARVNGAVLLGRRTRELAESEQRYRQVVDLAAEGIWIFDDRGVIRFANQAVANMLGHAVDDLVGSRLRDHLDDTSARRAERDRLRREHGIVEVVENTVQHADGHAVWVRVNATAIRNKDGEITGTLALLSDITARRAMEQAIAEREHRYATLVDHLPGSAVIVLDRDLNIVTAGGDALGEADYDPAGMIGHALESVLPHADFAYLRPYYDEALAGRSSGTFHFTARSGRTSLVDAVPLLEDERGVSQILVCIRDVTDLERNKEALRAAEKRFRAAFEQAPVGMSQISPTGRLELVNDALAALLGYVREDLIRRLDTEFTHPDDVAATAEAVHALATGRLNSHRVEKRYVHKDGHLIWVALSAVAVTDDTGGIPHLLAHYVDITERKDFEAQLEHLADHDPLTGLLNRRGFETELNRQAATVSRYGPAGALLMLDLDHFKQVNDTLGHGAGDELIVATAQLLRSIVRETDTVARLGGDEFAIILPHADRDDASTVANKIVRAIRQQVAVLAGQRRSVTTSVGVAMFDDRKMAGATALINADLAMYDAKGAGRDRLAFYNAATRA